jgi:EAL domain-containing protein (putative c-di-GMP-specific phosphodiesterase class I)
MDPRWLELEITEGVETAEQLEFLREHNCLEYQGYLCSQAVPAADVKRLLGRGS